jgi:hypothetical protein
MMRSCKPVYDKKVAESDKYLAERGDNKLGAQLKWTVGL